MKEIDETDIILDELINSIKSGPEYIQYISALSEIKNNPELYNQIKEFRRRNLENSLRDDIDYIKENDKLRDEFSSTLSNALANEFLSAEMKYVRKIRRIRNKLMDSVNLDLGFIDG
ncbi:MAG: YlbF family regulator [Lachnospiraceae bacterium]|nr:YlbF family regulator [Lachnospiraceae bacterium]